MNDTIVASIDSMASNPFITHMYTADPSAHVWEDGRLYVYASHDIDPPHGCDLMCFLPMIWCTGRIMEKS